MSIVLVVFSVLLVCVLPAIVPQARVPKLGGRIVGGEETTIENFPYQISLKYIGVHRCGGAIISEMIVVTAAHCINGVTARNLEVHAGSTLESTGGVYIEVNRYLKHKGYSSKTADNDIALLILSRPLKFSGSIKPIALAEQGEKMKAGSVAFISGWGLLEESGSNIPNVLHYAEVNIVDDQKCKKKYANKGVNITKSMLCAGAADGGKDSCLGDSGGPLVSKGKLIGIVSGGIGCGRKEYPSVYARISNLRNWIEKVRPDKF